jgi:hypothetical protein
MKAIEGEAQINKFEPNRELLLFGLTPVSISITDLICKVPHVITNPLCGR